MRCSLPGHCHAWRIFQCRFLTSIYDKTDLCIIILLSRFAVSTTHIRYRITYLPWTSESYRILYLLRSYIHFSTNTGRGIGMPMVYGRTESICMSGRPNTLPGKHGVASLKLGIGQRNGAEFDRTRGACSSATMRGSPPKVQRSFSAIPPACTGSLSILCLASASATNVSRASNSHNVAYDDNETR